MWFFADNDVQLLVDYQVDGEFVVPDSATYDLFGHDGAPILQAQALPAQATSESIVVSAANNSIGTDLFQNRYLHVRFISGGTSYQVNFAYSLSAFIPMTATPSHVRAEIGLDAKELPDRDIDLLRAYFTLKNRYGDAITTALTAADSTNLAVNKAIAVQAALDISTSFDLRTAIAVRSEDSSSRRSEKIDFDRIVSRLEKKLAPLVDASLGSSPASPIIFTLSTPTDALTGS